MMGVSAASISPSFFRMLLLHVQRRRIAMLIPVFLNQLVSHRGLYFFFFGSLSSSSLDGICIATGRSRGR